MENVVRTIAAYDGLGEDGVEEYLFRIHGPGQPVEIAVELESDVEMGYQLDLYSQPMRDRLMDLLDAVS